MHKESIELFNIEALKKDPAYKKEGEVKRENQQKRLGGIRQHTDENLWKPQWINQLDIKYTGKEDKCKLYWKLLVPKKIWVFCLWRYKWGKRNDYLQYRGNFLEFGVFRGTEIFFFVSHFSSSNLGCSFLLLLRPQWTQHSNQVPLLLVERRKYLEGFSLPSLPTPSVRAQPWLPGYGQRDVLKPGLSLGH